MSASQTESHALVNFIKECERTASLDLGSKAPKLELINDGLSNKNYIIKSSNKSYVLRENSNQSDFICCRDNEIACWQQAMNANLAPELIHLSSDKKHYLSEYIPQPQPKVIDSKMLLTLLEQLKGLPEPKLEITSQQQWRIYQDKIEMLFEELQHLIQAAPAFKSELELWKRCYRFIENRQNKLKSWTADITAATLSTQYSHRDLNSDNLLIRNEQLICIDFEYACAAEPLYDLISITESNLTSEIDKHTFAETYLAAHNGVSKNAIQVLPSMKKIYWSFFYYWALMMAGITLKQMLLTNSKMLATEFERFKGYLISFEYEL